MDKVYELANKYASFKISDETEELYKVGLKSMLGSKEKMKFNQFVGNEMLGKGQLQEVMDFFAGIKPERQEYENYESYKNRLKFQKVLYKNRKYFYYKNTPVILPADETEK